MTTPALIVVGLAALIVLWIAYRIGTILLRLALGLALLALIVYAFWRFLHP